MGCNPLESMPGSVVQPEVIVRSSSEHPDVRKAIDAYDPYWSEKTEMRDAVTPMRKKGSPA